MKHEQAKKVAENIGEKLVNSRINIVYNSEGKPDIKFEYVNPETEKRLHWTDAIMLPSLMIIGMIFIAITLATVIYIQTLDDPLQISNFTGSIVYNNHTGNFYSTILSYQYQGQNYWAELKPNPVTTLIIGRPVLEITSHLPVSVFRNIFVPIIAILFFFIGAISCLVLFAKFLAFVVKHTKWGHKNYPKWNKKLYNKKWSVEVKTEDLVYDMEGNVWEYEIPLFSNIYLDYRVEGDFSRYISNVKIVEHPFAHLVKKKGKILKKPNEYLWKATFTFKKLPKNGKLEVQFT